MKHNNIVLKAGINSPENIPVGQISSTGLIPLRGKPAIGWILEGLTQNGADEIILVFNKDNKNLVNYVKNVYAKIIKIKIIEISSHKTILHSLKAGLEAANSSHPSRIILGDTLICERLPQRTNIVLTSNDIKFSDYWGLIEKDENNFVTELFDKQKKLDLETKEALIGYYGVSDTNSFLNCVRMSIYKREKEIGAALKLYIKKRPIKAIKTNYWFDLGHPTGLVKARNSLFNARDFNSILTDTTLGILSKNSTKIQELADEAYWYETIPNDLKIFSPRLISYKENKDFATLTQELYGYPSLQEMFLFGDVNLEYWMLIIEKLFSIHKLFEKYSVETNKDDAKWLYSIKTWERLKELEQQDEYWQKLLQKEFIIINEKKFLNIPKLKSRIDKFIDNLMNNSTCTIIHGDFCFSNILFDSLNFVFKLIDPRGRLQKQTIYGDPRYDIAKLRHSAVGLYDFIVNGLYKISENSSTNFKFEIFSCVDYFQLEQIFDDIALKNGFNINEIKFIEALLFLSMIPLHKDCIKRQKMFYIKAIVSLNNILMKQ